MKRWILGFGLFVVILVSVSIYMLSKQISVPFITQPKDSNLTNISLPDGFQIAYVSQEVPGARSMIVSPNNIVYVGTRGEGKVYAVVLNDDYSGEVYTVIDNLNSPNGVAWHDGDLYVAEINRVIKFENIDELYDKSPDYSVVRDDFPTETHHGWKYLRVGPDEKLYVPIGAPCNSCESADPRFASLTRMNLDGSEFEVIAHGIRNTVGFDWHPFTQELWFTDNGRDWLGDDAPGDELNKITAIGKHYGFPYCHNEELLDPDFGKKTDCQQYMSPVQVLDPHVAALGMRFYTGNQFPESYKNTIFIAEHGSWNRSEPIGYRITTVTFDEYNEPSYDVFVEGWLHSNTVSGRPVDIVELQDGSLLVSDDFAGVIYRVSYEDIEY